MQHMDRLQVLADSIAARLGSGWPGRGPSDPRLTHISSLLTAVAELVERDAGELSTGRSAILLVTHAQGLIARAGLVLVDAAARNNLLRSPVGAERLLGKSHCAGQAWGTSRAGGPT